MKTILLVDDHEATRRLVQLTLGGAARYRVLQAADGPTAVRIASEQQVDLVLLDVAKGGMDGFAVSRTLAELPAHRRPRVVMLTASAGPADRERARSAGAIGFVAKPFSPIALLDGVRRILSPERAAATAA